MIKASYLSTVESPTYSLTMGITGRINAFLSIIERISECAAAIIPGAVTAITSLAVRKDSSYEALTRLDFAGTILSRPLPHFLNLFSPTAETPKTSFGEDADFGTRDLTTAGTYVLPKLNKKTSLFEAQILARCGFAVLAIAAIVNRTVQAVYSLLSVPHALVLMPFVSKQRSTELNQEAYSLLEWPKLIGDLFICATGIINPKQGIDLMFYRQTGGVTLEQCRESLNSEADLKQSCYQAC
ncbi:MAG: hypothetical protein Q8L98_02555 [Chlamydiales bacterium]|nr:hypothetical protein [Chlamydiales bacterium]